MANTDSPDNIAPPLAPPYAALEASANTASESADAASWTAFHGPRATGYREPPEAAGLECCITLRLSFFFDGTGNNRVADESTQQQTNIAKLFRAHPQDDASEGLFAFYMPGVGTYFPEIGDPGGASGLGFADGGQERIDWAIKQLDQAVARYPADKLVKIHISAFGFSRGAAEARAFANQVANRCSGKPSAPRWDTVDVPLDFYFLGLFDTVASVGLPATAGVASSIWRVSDLVSITTTMNSRRVSLRTLAYGPPGADPTPSLLDGHMTWGDEMKIPAMVTKCVSLVAAHEQRNSFPLDSVRLGARYPSNCEEFVYPGAHSDVGGGYRPGAQNKSMDIAKILSLMPLFHMHAVAIEHGVPLQGTEEFTDRDLRPLFQVTGNSIDLWNHYMDTAGRGGQPLGDMYLAHMRLWFAWRFHRINRFYSQNQDEWPEQQVVPDQQQLEAQSAQYAKEYKRLKARVAQLKRAHEAAEINAGTATYDLAIARSRVRYGDSNADITALSRAKKEAERALESANDALQRAEELLGNVPLRDYVNNLHQYDIALMKDMATLRDSTQSWALFWLDADDLTPFYRMQLECYEAEFFNNAGLRDEKIIEFFDDYVHDSLAGFAKDASAPSDPRCVYVGEDNEVRYAGLTEESAAVEVT